MTLFERFTNIWTKDQDTRIVALMEANAGMHNVERRTRKAGSLRAGAAPLSRLR